MYASSPRSTPAARRRRQNGRGAMPVSRSGSFLNSLKSFVTSQLPWFGTNDENVDENGKRRREASKEIEDLEEDRSQSKSKRARVESPALVPPPKHLPPSTSAYLDPPTSSLQPIQQNVNPGKDGRSSYVKQSATFGGLPSSTSRSMSRTMSIDPPSAFSNMSLHRNPSMMSLSSPIEARSSMSLAPRELSRQPSSGPFKLRSSLTPQPSGVRQLRREASAPPPLSSLQTRPVFVRPPDEEQVDKHASRELRAQKTMSLGAYADFNKGTRARSRDRTLTSYDSIESVPPSSASHSNDVSKLQLRPSQSFTEKTFHDLEIYKTPFMPSRYKDSDAIPVFLRPLRAHVPIPMDKKDRKSKPSLGLPAPEESRKLKKSSRHVGKPYGERGGISKVIERRKAEEKEEGRQNRKRVLKIVEEEEEMDTDAGISKRDSGVLDGLSGSEDEQSVATKKDVYASKASEIGSKSLAAMGDPFMQERVALVSGGRIQPYGRVGRTRVRDSSQRSVPLGRSSNRFSAVFDEDDDADMAKMDAGQASEGSTTAALFEAPKGFSFAQDTKPVEHQCEGAKEPPLQSLPFSFANAAAQGAPTTSVRTPWIDTTIASTVSNDGEKKTVTLAPKEDFPKEGLAASSKPSFQFAAPLDSSNLEPGVKEAKSTVPNFFANSALFSKNKATMSEPTPPAIQSSSGQSSTTGPAILPSEGVEKIPNPTSEVTQEAVTKPPFSFGKPAVGSSSSPSTPPLGGILPKQSEATASKAPAPVSLFGAPSKTVSQSNLLFPMPSNAEEPSKQPASHAAPTAPFSFGTSSASSTVPKPLFGFGANPTASTPSNLASSIQSSTPTTVAPAAAESKSHLTFGSTAPTPPTSGGSGEHKPAFSFGAPASPAKTLNNAPSAATSISATSISATSISAPKPLFGQASGSTMFNFGMNAPSLAPTASLAAPKSTPSPFAFGAAPATPPASNDRQGSPFTFGNATQASSSLSGTMFQFGASPSGTAPVAAVAASSPFSFNNPPRPVTPPSKPDEGMNMEESPTRMDIGAKPQGTISFGTGPTPTNPFGQPSTPSSSAFTFGQPANTNTQNPFAPKVENNFNRTSSAPAISTNFSFGPKNDQPTPPATAFGTPSTPFGQPPQSSGSTTSTPFTFGQPPSTLASNLFGVSQSNPSIAVPSTSFGQPSTSSFTFGTPSNASASPFTFGSQPSSPATMPGALPQSPAGTNPSFAFGAPSGSAGGPSFNIGAPPPSSSGTPGRQVKKLPNRARPPPKR